jgi:hypothetical protein
MSAQPAAKQDARLAVEATPKLGSRPGCRHGGQRGPVLDCVSGPFLQAKTRVPKTRVAFSPGNGAMVAAHAAWPVLKKHLGFDVAPSCLRGEQQLKELEAIATGTNSRHHRPTVQAFEPQTNAASLAVF